jgi:hypothetical protein
MNQERQCIKTIPYLHRRKGEVKYSFVKSVLPTVCKQFKVSFFFVTVLQYRPPTNLNRKKTSLRNLTNSITMIPIIKSELSLFYQVAKINVDRSNVGNVDLIHIYPNILQQVHIFHIAHISPKLTTVVFKKVYIRRKDYFKFDLMLYLIKPKH